METILQKVKKLLALASESGNSNEHERASAMAKAMALLAEHNLTLTNVDAFGKAPPIDVISHKDLTTKLEPFVRTLISATCKLYYTGYYMAYYGKGYVPCFYGTRENIDVTMEVSRFIIDSVRSESKRIYRDARSRKDFCLGAAQVIWQRTLQMLKDEAPQDQTVTTTNALVVVRDTLTKANDAFKSTLNLTTSRSRSSTIRNCSAFSSGKAFGSSVNLTRRTAHVRIGG